MQARERGGGGMEREPAIGIPAWLPWLQLAISTTLAVLFVVVLARSREQSRQLGVLQQRVQGLETSRALDRTGLLEQQLRSMVERLQSLEREQRRQEQTLREQAELGQQLERLQRRPADGGGRGAGLPAPPAAATDPATGAPRPPAAGPGGGGPAVLRPPGMDEF
jgi:hypothetical protein